MNISQWGNSEHKLNYGVMINKGLEDWVGGMEASKIVSDRWHFKKKLIYLLLLALLTGKIADAIWDIFPISSQRNE